MRYNRQDAHGAWHRGSIQSMCTATISSNMRIVIFKLPVPTGSVGGGSPTPSAAGQAGRDDKRRAGPKAPIPCFLIKIKTAFRHPSAVHCSAKASSPDSVPPRTWKVPSFLSPPLSHFLYLKPEL